MRLWIKSWSVTIQIEATEQYFPVVLFVALYKVVFSVILSVIIRMQVTEQYSPVVLFLCYEM